MFERLIGNDSAKGTLKRLIGAGRVSNALLFAGPAGVGKREFAIEIARAFLCAVPVGGEGCGGCVACRRSGAIELPKPDNKDDFKKVVFSEHPDVGIVAAYNRNILVDAIRDLEREANYRPYEGRARFFIIDDAEKMNDAASNALLKTLEEPPPATYIILIASRPDSLLQTIRSRCQFVRFAPVPREAVRDHLVASGRALAEDAQLIASVSNGSIGAALSLDVAKFREQRSAMLDVIERAAAMHDVAAALRASEQLSDPKRKDDFESSLDILAMLIRDIWLVRQGSRDIRNIDLADQLADSARSLGTAPMAEWLEHIEQLRQSFAVNINRKIAADALFAGMAA